MHSIYNKLHLVGIAAAIGLAGSGIAAHAAETATPEQMAEQIRELQAKVDRLEHEHALAPAPAAATPSSTSDAPSTVETRQAVQNDADHRTLFSVAAPAPITAGWDGKQFIIRSEDGAFSLHPGVTFDFRNMTSYREQIPKGGGGETGSTGYDTQSGFEITRMRFSLDGTVFRQIGYYFQLSADQGNPVTLLDAYVTYRFDDSPYTLKLGQFKDPVWHERNLSEARLMAVDRSLVENFLGGGQGSRVQGVALIYDKDRFRAQGVFHDGFNSQNTKFIDSGGVGVGVGGAAGITPDDFGGSGRVEFLALGRRDATHNPFAEYDGGFSSLGFSQSTLIFGAGADFTQAGANDMLLHSIDAQFNMPGGLSAYAAYLGSYRAIQTNHGVAPGYYYDPGFLVQVAYLIRHRFEPFARYDWTHLDPDSVNLSTHIVQEITVGANYYLYKQNAKLTLDAGYLPDGSPTDVDALGVLRNVDRNEFVLRGQFQLSI